MEFVKASKEQTVSESEASTLLRNFLSSRLEDGDLTALYTGKQSVGALDSNTFVQLSFVQSSIEAALGDEESDEDDEE
jgi:hypothetical protein